MIEPSAVPADTRVTQNQGACMKQITEPAPALPTNQPPPTVTTLLRLPQVKEVTGLGTTSIWKLVKERDFPPPICLTGRARAWRSDEVQSWIDSRPRSEGGNDHA
jgi:prophage regulatory protein